MINRSGSVITDVIMLMKNERKTKFAWDDFKPRERSRNDIELEFVSFLLTCPKGFDAIAKLLPQIQFKKQIHGELFRVLHNLYRTDKSIDSLELLERLNENVNIAREWTIADIRNLQFPNRHPGSRTVSGAQTISERAEELARELIDLDR